MCLNAWVWITYLYLSCKGGLGTGDILRFLGERQSAWLINIQKVIISQTHKGDLHAGPKNYLYNIFACIQNYCNFSILDSLYILLFFQKSNTSFKIQLQFLFLHVMPPLPHPAKGIHQAFFLPPLVQMSAFVFSHSVVSSSLWPRELQPASLLCPCSSPGKNTEVGCHFLLRGTFPNQGSSPCLLCLLH